MSKKEISIIIVNWNGKHLLKTCLDSIFDQNYDNAEVILVDNGSMDGSVDFVREKYPAVKVIALNRNYGFARANNEGIKISRGKAILLLNNDTKILPGAIESMFSFLFSDGKIGIIGPKLLFPDGKLQRSCRRFPSLKYELFSAFFLNTFFPKSKVFNGYLMGDFGHTETKEVNQIMGAALMIKREVVNRISLLDERFFMFYEEVDWCYRVKRAGYKILFFPEAKIIHYGGKSSENNILNILTYIEESKFKFFRKNYGKSGVLGLVFINFIKIITYYLIIIFSLIQNKERSRIYHHKVRVCLRTMRMSRKTV